jgi:hypothetical protein
MSSSAFDIIVLKNSSCSFTFGEIREANHTIRRE